MATPTSSCIYMIVPSSAPSNELAITYLPPLSAKHRQELTNFHQKDIRIKQGIYCDCFPLSSMYALITNGSTAFLSKTLRVHDNRCEVLIAKKDCCKSFQDIKRDLESTVNGRIPYGIRDENYDPDYYVVIVSEVKLTSFENSNTGRVESNSLIIKILDNILSAFLITSNNKSNNDKTISSNYNNRSLSEGYFDFLCNKLAISGVISHDCCEASYLKFLFSNLPVVVRVPWYKNGSMAGWHGVALSGIKRATNKPLMLTAINPHNTAASINEITVENFSQINKLAKKKGLKLENLLILNCSDRIIVYYNNLALTTIIKGNQSTVYYHQTNHDIAFFIPFEKPEHQLVRLLLDENLLKPLAQHTSSSTNTNDDLQTKYLAIFAKYSNANHNSTIYIAQLRNDLLDCTIEYILHNFTPTTIPEDEPQTAKAILAQCPQLKSIVAVVFPENVNHDNDILNAITDSLFRIHTPIEKLTSMTYQDIASKIFTFKSADQYFCISIAMFNAILAGPEQSPLKEEQRQSLLLRLSKLRNSILHPSTKHLGRLEDLYVAYSQKILSSQDRNKIAELTKFCPSDSDSAATPIFSSSQSFFRGQLLKSPKTHVFFEVRLNADQIKQNFGAAKFNELHLLANKSASASTSITIQLNPSFQVNAVVFPCAGNNNQELIFSFDCRTDANCFSKAMSIQADQIERNLCYY